ncbi:MAG: hypothetical protein JWO25_2447 [Alphaproteobacteria bacterium]|nr:hypothetical protein [Alphaproteobacteria bacterium]MDB5722143.1 hypothetical protein [Alphaproteobacteria bacterium]
MDLAEHETGLLVQFGRMAGIYELSKSDRNFENFAALLRSARDTGSELTFELLGSQIVSVEKGLP